MWKISNEDLLRHVIKKVRLQFWLEDVGNGLDMCLEEIKITRTALYWTPEGKAWKTKEHMETYGRMRA